MRLILVFFCSLLLNVAQSQTSPKLIVTVEGIKEYELTNGLRILLMPDASQTNIAVNIVYKVGSRHEGYGESGMDHLLEHMLFKQCKKFVDIKKAIADTMAKLLYFMFITLGVTDGLFFYFFGSFRIVL